MNIIRSKLKWFIHGELSPDITLSVILLGFTISFIHKAYLFLVILNRLPDMFDILNYIC